jgi:hypothetical protein
MLAGFLTPFAVPVKLILDTDMGGGPCQDVDDAGTLCMLNVLQDRGEVELQAIMLDTLPPAGAGAISVLQHWFGRDSVPIGVMRPDASPNIVAHPYVDQLVHGWEAPIKSSVGLPRAVDLYRRILGGADDKSIAIASVGVLTNLEHLCADKCGVRTPTALTDCAPTNKCIALYINQSVSHTVASTWRHTGSSHVPSFACVVML